MKNILFRVDANPQIGMGHFYRCLSLAQMLSDHFRIKFAMIDPIDSIKDILLKYNFQVLALPFQNYTVPDNHFNNELEFDLSDDHLNFIDVVVVDGYWFGKRYLKYLRSKVKITTVIEDFGEGEYNVDLIINHAPGIDAINYVTPERTIFALGPEYSLLRPSFLEEAKNKNSNYNDLNRIFICFGGSDVYNLTYQTASWFLQHTNKILHIIIGAAYEHSAHLDKLKDSFGERLIIKSNLNEEEMLKEMKNCGFGILPASGILFEAITAKLPVISGFYTSNQKQIYEGFKKYEVFFGVENFTNVIWNDVINKINNDIIQQLVRNQSLCIDGFSPNRYVNLFKSLC